MGSEGAGNQEWPASGLVRQAVRQDWLIQQQQRCDRRWHNSGVVGVDGFTVFVKDRKALEVGDGDGAAAGAFLEEHVALIIL